MEINKLTERPGVESNEKWAKKTRYFRQLIDELNAREIPDGPAARINEEIDQLNAFTGDDKSYMRHLTNTQSRVLKFVEKELKLVPKGYYRTVWLVVGMAAFGTPLGTAFGIAMGNMAFIGIGLPIGMAIGIALGSGMDKKAADEGRQLNVEM
ncbi:MAG: hypothetical protein KDD12_17730 [Lewinella sp.]|nr:hypothetical protein [Lewinella sp.]